MEPMRQFDLDPAALYSITKAGMNVAVAKFSAQYKKDGVLFLSISPGVVDVGHGSDGEIMFPSSMIQLTLTCHCVATPEQMQKLGVMFQKFQEWAPHFQGPAQPEDSIRDMLATIRRASIADGFGGGFVSHHGDKQWL